MKALKKLTYLFCATALFLTACPGDPGEVLAPAPQPGTGGDGGVDQVPVTSDDDDGGTTTTTTTGVGGSGGETGTGGDGGDGGEPPVDPCPEGLSDCKTACYQDFLVCKDACNECSGWQACVEACWTVKGECKQWCRDNCECSGSCSSEDDD